MYKKMSLGPIISDLRGLRLETDEREMLLHPHIGGVILFSRNYKSPQQLSELTKSIHEIRSPRLLVTVDHEGGNIQRFRDGFTSLPFCAFLGRYGSLQETNKLAEHAGWLMAAELLAVGVDISFAPVLDIANKDSKLIGYRSFHEKPNEVARLAISYMNGMKHAGMVAVGKHFPGHGSVIEDSHIELPYDYRDYENILKHDLVPFIKLIDAGMLAFMSAHVIYPMVDKLPATFSPIWLKDIIRKQLNFKGLVFSDDLSMEGAKIIGDYLERANVALQAGCDMILVCNNQAGTIEILDKIKLKDNKTLQFKIEKLYGSFDKKLDELKQSTLWRERFTTLENLSQNIKQ